MPRLNEVGAELLAPIQGIVFDKDGTLADLDQRWVPFFRDVIRTTAAHGGDPGAEESLAAVLGLGTDRLMPGSPAAVKSEGELLSIAVSHLVERGWTSEKAVEAISTGVKTANLGPIAPLGDVAGAMEALSHRFQLGIATSDNRGATIDELKEMGILDHINIMHCGDDGASVKPDPEVLLRIARAWQIEPHKLLFVGDASQDLDTARAAASPFVAVTPHGADGSPSLTGIAADAWIFSIEELADLTGQGGR